MNIKNDISQEEVNSLNIGENIKMTDDIKNYIILIKNELLAFDNEINKNHEKHFIKIRKRLNKILIELINLRKFGHS